MSEDMEKKMIELIEDMRTEMNDGFSKCSERMDDMINDLGEIKDMLSTLKKGGITYV
ncbi:hypothetical protein [Lysinibacillus endophyticus]|uniref:hypothetical protein n=1 Tax=Ureibacillus endophyticus TaxID=1978490 RepID=UPI00209F6372|nr:hypothetical protein [Lysinibacillus endophyticus]MCP1145793.1 hypothetical protein [Lysinibacillus endophyticus]